MFLRHLRVYDKYYSRENPLSLNRAIQLCRSFDASHAQSNQMRTAASSSDNVNQIDLKRRQILNRKSDTSVKQATMIPIINDCRFCGRSHKRLKANCPAFGRTCNKCGGMNHFSKKSRTNLHALHEKSCEQATDTEYLNAMKNCKSKLTALLKINDCEVRFQLDTGARISQKGCFSFLFLNLD